MPNTIETPAADSPSQPSSSSFVGRLVQRYGGWTTRISGALVDQALFSGSNFVINVALANWMFEDEYGAFVVVYSWFLLLQNLYEAVMVEPMSIYGAGKHAHRFRQYLGYLFFGHIGFGFIAFAVLGAAAIFSSISDTGIVSSALMGAAIGSPFLLLRWLTRQPFYILSKPHWSALGGFIYLGVTMLALYIFNVQGWLNAFTALMALAVGSVISAAFLAIVFLHPNLRLKTHDTMNARSILSDHWQYGRWSTADRILGWIPANFHYVVLPLLFSLAESGALRAVLNLTMPITLGIVAINGLLLPSFVRKYSTGGRSAVDQQLVFALKLVLFFTGLYFVGVVLFGGPLLSFIYNGRYDEYVTFPLLLTMGSWPVIMGGSVVVDAALRATGRVKYSFISKIIPALITVTIGLGLLAAFKLVGANLNMMIVNLVMLGISLWFYVRVSDDKTKNDEPLQEARQ